MSDFYFEPDSEVIPKFLESTAQEVYLSGAFASGSSSAMVAKAVLNASRQVPGYDGVRRTRIGFFRKSYPSVDTSLIPTIKQWIPADWGKIVYSHPRVLNLSFALEDGTHVYSEWWFYGLSQDKGGQRGLEILLSLELTHAIINEATEFHEAAIDRIMGRIGRFPPVAYARPTHPQILLDFNLPSKEHWLYRRAELNADARLVPTGTYDEQGEPEYVKRTKAFFKQPPAVFILNREDVDNNGALPQYQLNPEADNLRYLPEGYYSQMLVENPTPAQYREILSKLAMEWVSPPAGALVYPEFKRGRHVAEEPILYDADLNVYLGIDTSGIHPAAVIGQYKQGSLKVIGEVYAGTTSFTSFIEDNLKPKLTELCPGVLIAKRGTLLAVCDPANARGSELGLQPTELLQRAGIPAQTASTNRFNERREAVAQLLTRYDGLVISPTCTNTILGIEEDYVFPLIKTHDSERFADKPVKNSASHLQDALQYLALAVTGAAMDVFYDYAPRLSHGQKYV